MRKRQHREPNIRDTSILSYLESLGSGLINEQQEEVLRCIARNPGKTSRELDELMLVQDVSHRRTSELEEECFIEARGERTCTLSNRKSLVWYALTEEQRNARIAEENPKKGTLHRLTAHDWTIINLVSKPRLLKSRSNKGRKIFYIKRGMEMRITKYKGNTRYNLFVRS